MSKRSVVTFVFMVIAAAAAPLYAQEPAAGGLASPTEVAKWSIITAGFALAFAAGLAALAPWVSGLRWADRLRSAATRLATPAAIGAEKLVPFWTV